MAAFDRAIRPTLKPRGYPNGPERGVLRYDESGQVYREVIVKADDWTQRRKGDVRRFQNHRSSGPGCSSLANMALRCCLVNSDCLTAESLQNVPEVIAMKLWKTIRKAPAFVTSDLHTFTLSIAFSAICPGYLPYVHHHLYDLPSSLKWELQCLTKPPYIHLTCLSISSIPHPHSYLACLASCPALTVLTLGPDRNGDEWSAMDDRLIRNWSLQAAAPPSSKTSNSGEQNCGFQSLRVLIIRSPHQMTTTVFQYLYRFPSLMMLLLEDVPNLTVVQQTMKWVPQKSTTQQAGLHGWLQNPERWHSFMNKHKVPDRISWNKAIEHLRALAEDHARNLHVTSPPQTQTQTQAQSESEAICRSSSAPLMHLSIGSDPPDGLRINREVACCWFRSRELCPSARSRAIADSQTTRTVASGKNKRAAEDPAYRASKRKPPMLKSAKQVDMTETMSLFGR